MLITHQYARHGGGGGAGLVQGALVLSEFSICHFQVSGAERDAEQKRPDLFVPKTSTYYVTICLSVAGQAQNS